MLQLGFLLVNSLHRQLAASLLGHFHLARIPAAVSGLLRGGIRFGGSRKTKSENLVEARLSSSAPSGDQPLSE